MRVDGLVPIKGPTFSTTHIPSVKGWRGVHLMVWAQNGNARPPGPESAETVSLTLCRPAFTRGPVPSTIRIPSGEKGTFFTSLFNVFVSFRGLPWSVILVVSALSYTSVLWSSSVEYPNQTGSFCFSILLLGLNFTLWSG